MYTRSKGVYRFPKNNELITEETQKQSLNAYHENKLEGENELKKFKNLHVSITGPPFVLGPRSLAVKIISSKLIASLFYSPLSIYFLKISNL
jgi:hypothetical protein